MLPLLSEVKKRRKLLGLTQTDLAKRSGVSQSLIAKIESQNIDPTYTKACSILETLDDMEEQTSVKAKEIMHKKIVSVNPKDKLTTAVAMMKKHQISQIPVIQNNSIIGSVSENDILMLIASGKDVTSSSILVNDVVSEPFPTIDENSPIALVASLLKYNRAVILTKKGKIAGIITKADLLKIMK